MECSSNRNSFVAPKQQGISPIYVYLQNMHLRYTLSIYRVLSRSETTGNKLELRRYVEWPVRIPCLTVLDFYLRDGHVKALV